jgi:peptidoglycan/LPS O-acetylase OafA/YrhL
MGKKRNIALDFNRGMLIIIMILLHCIDDLAPLSYFAKSIRFVSGAFIFVAGFVISNIYLAKYNIYEKGLYKRLFIRGVKLLLVFSVLNGLMLLLISRPYNGAGQEQFLSNLVQVYITGDRTLVSFDILLPISYVMIISSILILFLRERFKAVIVSASVSLFLFCAIFYFSGPISYNFRFLTIGIFGLMAGFANIEEVDDALNRYWMPVIAVYATYLITIAFLPFNYLLYVAGVFMNVVVIYLLGLKLKPDSFLAGRVILLGRYSLLTYIAHIGFLVVLRQLMYSALELQNNFPTFISSFAVTAIAMLLLIELMDVLRKKIEVFDRLYKYVFA